MSRGRSPWETAAAVGAVLSVGVLAGTTHTEPVQRISLAVLALAVGLAALFESRVKRSWAAPLCSICGAPVPTRCKVRYFDQDARRICSVCADELLERPIRARRTS